MGLDLGRGLWLDFDFEPVPLGMGQAAHPAAADEFTMEDVPRMDGARDTRSHSAAQSTKAGMTPARCCSGGARCVEDVRKQEGEAGRRAPGGGLDA